MVISGPNWPITVRFGHFGSKLTNHGLFWSFWVQIGQSRSVFISFGPNCYFYRSRSKTFCHNGPVFVKNRKSIDKPADNSLDYKGSLRSFFFVFSFLVSSIVSIYRVKLKNWRLSKKAKIFIFDLEHFQKFGSFSILAFQKFGPNDF